MKSLSLILIIQSLLISNCIYGQSDNIPENDSIALYKIAEPVTISAFRSPYNIFNIPAPVSLITETRLRTGNALTPVEALNQVPGVLMHHGTLNTNRLTIRGIGSRSPYSTNKIKAYFGEIPLTSGDGETTLEDLENSTISKVEIIKGPSSSLYGAGLAGVILFYPTYIKNDFIKNDFTAASFGTLKNTLSAGISKEKLNIFAQGSALKSDGFRDNNTTKRSGLFFNTTYQFSENSNLKLLIKATNMDAQIPSSLNIEDFKNSPQNAAINWLGVKGYEKYSTAQFGISYHHNFQKNSKISIASFGSYKDADELRPFNHFFENAHFWGWRGSFQKELSSQSVNIVFTGGIEFFRERYNWSTRENDLPNSLLSDNKEHRQYENIFLQVETGLFERVFISAGINGNLTRFKYMDKFLQNGDQSGKYNYNPVISPRLGFNYLLLQNFSVFGNISHGFSTPTFEETLLPEGNLNYDIKPETGWSTEVGIRSNFSDRIQFNVSYYRIYINNLLVARRTGEDAYVGVNAGKSLHPGLETEIRWNVFNPENQVKLSLIGNATFANYRFTDFIDREIDYSGKNLPSTAKNTWMLMAIFNPAENTGLTLWHRHTGEMPLNDANSGFSDAFGITNLELKHTFMFQKLQLCIKGGIQNIFDINYASMLAVNAPSFGGNPARYYYPGNPRNFYFTFIIERF